MERSSSLVLKKDLTVDEKIAVLLASLDQKLAASVIQQLEPRLMVRVTNALKNLGVVSGDVRDKAIADSLAGIKSVGMGVQGDATLANSLLVQAVGEKKASALLMNEAGDSTQRAFADLSNADPNAVAAALAGESPSIIAIVLKRLPSTLAAEILELLPAPLRKRAMVCICTAADPGGEVISRIESLMNSRLASGGKPKKLQETGDKVGIIAAIIQNANKSVGDDLLSAIQEKSEQLAAQVKDKLFTFEDIAGMADSAVRRVLQEVDASLLSTALRGTNAELQQKFFSNMSKRAAQALREDIELSSKVRRSEVDAKRREIVAVIRSLESEGQLTTGGSDEYI